MKIPALFIGYHSVAITAISFPLFGSTEWSTHNPVAPTASNAPEIEIHYQHQFGGRIIGKERTSTLFYISEGGGAFNYQP